MTDDPPAHEKEPNPAGASPSGAPTRSADELFQEAMQHVALRNYGDAILLCRQALFYAPAQIDARLLLGMSLLSVGRFSEARAEMRAVLKLDPTHVEAHRLLGEAFLRAGKPEEAAPVFRQTLALNPADEQARALLAEAELEAKERPVEGTLNRWFDPINLATKKSSLPEWTEEHEATGENPLGQSGSTSLPDLEARDLARSDTTITAPVTAPSFVPEQRRNLAAASFPIASTIITSEVPSPGTRPRAYDKEGRGHASRPLVTAEAPGDPAAERTDALRERPRAQEEPDTDAREFPASEGPETTDATGHGLSTVSLHAFSSGHEASELTREEQALLLGVSPEPLPGEATVAWGLHHAPDHSGPARDEASTRVVVPPPGAAGPDDVVLPPNPAVPRERRRRVSLLVLVVVLAGVLVAAGIVAGVTLMGAGIFSRRGSEANVRVLLAEACRTGRTSSLQEALDLGDETLGDTQSEKALRARLLAMATLELGVRHQSAVEKLLEQLSKPSLAAQDAQLALAYLALARGDWKTAETQLPALEKAKPSDSSGSAPPLASAGEVAYVRARVLRQAGKGSQAISVAKDALEHFPRSPRFAALLVQLLVEEGDLLGARAVEKGFIERTVPRFEAARMILRFSEGAEPGAVQLADKLIRSVRDDPQVLGAAHLVRARAAIRTGSLAQARAEARKAQANAPAGEERFLLDLGETFLAAEDAHAAREVLRQLPHEGVAPDRRARFSAELAVLSGDMTELRGSPAIEGDDGQALYLRGRAAEAMGDLRAATTLLERATKDADQYVRSVVALARIQSLTGRHKAAVLLLRRAYRRKPGAIEVMAAYSEALLAAGQGTREAETVLASAERLHPEAPALLRMRALLLVAQGHLDDALVSWKALAARHPENLAILFQCGVLEENTADLETANASYQTVLQKDPQHPGALQGRVRVAIAQGNWPQVEETLEDARAGGVPDTVLWRLRAQFYVARGDGALAVNALEGAPRLAQDAVLQELLGHALFQAEQDKLASKALDRALALGPGGAGVALGQAWLALRQGRAADATSKLEAAETAVEGPLVEGETPRFVLRAQLLAAHARLAFEGGAFAVSQTRAEAALQIDPRCAQAHAVLAERALEAHEDPVPHYREALRGHAPQPEVLAQLALRLPPAEACAAAARYLERAPTGLDAPAMTRLVAPCESAPPSPAPRPPE